MDNVISGFNQLMNVDHIAWADGPGWLLCLFVGWIAMIAESPEARSCTYCTASCSSKSGRSQ